MRRIAYVGGLVVAALAAIASHECGHNPPGGGCVYLPGYQGGDHYCSGFGGHGDLPFDVPNWPVMGYGAAAPHQPPNNVIGVHLTDSVRDWHPTWAQHYNNAIGEWNDHTTYSVFHSVSSIFEATLWVVRPGTPDESQVNAIAADIGMPFDANQSTCTGGSGAWATLNFGGAVTVAGHVHRQVHKVCMWGSPNPVAPNGFNGEACGPGCPGYHYWWLTLMHEFGHALSLEHEIAGQCVMLSGYAMRRPCAPEFNWVNHHYWPQ
jgi:hypothetical protein